MKDIKRRIKSIESTAQITKAMELVASSKLRKAKERALAATPFFNTLYQTICEIAAISKHLSSPYVKKREVKNSLLIVIAGDRGLAGGYNNNIIKLANAKIAQNKQNGIETKIIGVGKKAVEYYQKRNMLLKGFSNFADDVDSIRSRLVSQLALGLYDRGEIDEIILYYTQFISVLNQNPSEIAVLPLSNLAENTTVEKTSEVLYEPSAEAVFAQTVPLYVGGIIYCAVSESYASEQGARRTAMESASDNAKEMIDTLSLSYNRARQSSITQEITEIVAGAKEA